MQQYKENQMEDVGRCLHLLLERLGAITFDYDIVKDVMLFSIANTGGELRRIEAYRKKLCTVNRAAVHPDFLDRLLAVYMGQNVTAQEFLMDPSPRPTGKFSWYEVVVQPIFDVEGHIVRTLGIFWNIEDRKGQMETSFARFRSERDPITGILNQQGMEKAAAAYLAAQGIEENNVLLLVYLKNFGAIEEQRGKRWSDQLLIRICKGLGRLFRAGDLLAHLGGGRFAVFIKDVNMPEVVALKMQAIKALFAVDAEYGAYDFDCRVETAFYPKEGNSYLELFALARDKIGVRD